MKDSEKVVLTSFLYALAQQEHPLPAEVQLGLNTIAGSYEKNIATLQTIAQENASLHPFYQQSYTWLLSQSARRGMGLDFLPADNRDRENDEIENITRDPSTEIDRLEKIIQNIEAKLGKTKAILANNNSVDLAQKELLS